MNVVHVDVPQVSPRPITVNVTDAGLSTYELHASSANVAAEDVELLCSSVFELTAVIRALRDGAA